MMMNPGVMQNIAQMLNQRRPGASGMMAGPQPQAAMGNMTAMPPPGSGPGGMMLPATGPSQGSNTLPRPGVMQNLPASAPQMRRPGMAPIRAF